MTANSPVLLATRQDLSWGVRRWAQVSKQLNAVRTKLAAAEAATLEARQQATTVAPDAYAGAYENAALGRMVVTDADVQDDATHRFRVDLAGAPMTIGFAVPEGSQSPTAVRFLNETFTRVPLKVARAAPSR